MGLSIGILAGAILAGIGIVTKNVAVALAGKIDAITALSWIWWDGKGVTVTIPKYVFKVRHGFVEFYNGVHFGVKRLSW